MQQMTPEGHCCPICIDSRWCVHHNQIREVRFVSQANSFIQLDWFWFVDPGKNAIISWKVVIIILIFCRMRECSVLMSFSPFHLGHLPYHWTWRPTRSSSCSLSFTCLVVSHQGWDYVTASRFPPLQGNVSTMYHEKLAETCSSSLLSIEQNLQIESVLFLPRARCARPHQGLRNMTYSHLE